jgi:cupin superfamily acireductone dioxygenase involved in methionine salvage
LKEIVSISPDLLRDLLTEDAAQTAISATDITETEAALAIFAQSFAVTPSLPVRDRILGKIQKLNAYQQHRQPISLDNVPLLTAESNWLDWEEAVKDIAPPADLENIHLHPIREDEQVQLFVAYVREFIEEEVHHDLLESFVLLEGSCSCHMTREDGSTYTVNMVAGDYIEMKLGEHHDVTITSARPAKAILQWLKLAA